MLYNISQAHFIEVQYFALLFEQILLKGVNIRGFKKARQWTKQLYMTVKENGIPSDFVNLTEN